jgi:hypothetical protein
MTTVTERIINHIKAVRVDVWASQIKRYRVPEYKGFMNFLNSYVRSMLVPFRYQLTKNISKITAPWKKCFCSRGGKQKKF